MKSPLVPTARSRRAALGRARGGRPAALGLAVLATGLLAGCAVDNTPTAYDDQVRSNFIASCTGAAPTAASTTTVLANENVCVCAYDVFYNQVPYNAEDRTRVTGYPQDKPLFQDLENELANDPNRYDELPQGVRDAVERCEGQSNLGPVAPGTTATAGATGTSAPA